MNKNLHKSMHIPHLNYILLRKVCVDNSRYSIQKTLIECLYGFPPPLERLQYIEFK